MVRALCVGGNAEFQSSLPDQKILCGTHTIHVFESSECLTSEYLITLDNVNLSCVSQDDSYLDSLTNLLDAYCN
eukprot:CAMPEP_0201524848 /NCGR_PEP_ID=MMETSP0161_2-20130828/25508_1 /ASSEMBLY_ACC=CAM_ASM_000251 /TAXON_ID=180227 /ORGANISM="Neoparamoeba aestuarina, Strain SoJaBio B1-5/56/2" /LENGTH=73 /DNA_ID=CAMNT_0047924459 /DNA_START=114 /DNA_END=332 /DNA_ORIENTATION=+